MIRDDTKKSEINLRSLTLDQWQLLRSMRIHAATLHPTVFYDTAQTASNHPPSHWQNLLSGEGNKFWGLFHAGKCIAFAGVVTVTNDRANHTGMIGYCFIEAEYRRKGLSNLLFEAGINHALHHTKWKALATDHRIGNEASRKAILRHGFAFTEKLMIDWPDGSRDYELRYELDLEQLRLRILGSCV